MAPLPHLYVEASIPSVITLGGGAFEWQLGLDEVIRVEPPQRD